MVYTLEVYDTEEHMFGLWIQEELEWNPGSALPGYMTLMTILNFSELGFLHISSSCTWIRVTEIYRAYMEKEMATHSSTFAWKIPWNGEPGRLQSMGSQ